MSDEADISVQLVLVPGISTHVNPLSVTVGAEEERDKFACGTVIAIGPATRTVGANVESRRFA